MTDSNRFTAIFLGLCVFSGLASLGYLLGHAAIQYKEYERVVTVKGLSEREFEADIITVSSTHLTLPTKTIL